MADFIKYIVSELKSKRLPKESARSLLEQFARGAGAAQPARLHPLVHANTSDLSEQSFSSWFDGSEFFLADHRVRLGGADSSRVLPAVAYLEMARAALRLALPQAADSWLELRQVAWAQPVLVNGRTKVSIALQGAGEQGEVDFEVYSLDDDGQERVHCQGRAGYRNGAGYAPLPLAELEQQMQAGALAGDALYAQLWQMGLEYGPAHRALESLARGEGQALARLSVPSQAGPDWHSYELHPSLMDGALQACIGLLAPQDSGGQLLLPYAVESVEALRPCPRQVLAWVRYAADSNAAVRKLDIDLCDEQGQVCVRMRAFSARAVDAGAPAAAPMIAWASPHWQAAPPQDGPAVKQRHVWLSGLAQVNLAALAASLRSATCMRLQDEAADVVGRYMLQAGACLAQLQALLSGKLAGRTLVQLIVADDGEQALGAGLAAMLRTASQEQPQLVCQLVLVEPGVDTGALARLLQGEQGEQALVRVRDGRREVQLWQEQHWQGAAWPLAYRDDGVYLITGGLGGLGRLFAQDILRCKAAAQVVLTGRGALDGARLAQLDSLAAPGRVHYRQLDLEDAGQVQALLDSVCATFGRLDGIIHSAGQLADALIRNKNAQDMRAVLGPKVAGTVNLDLASRDVALDFLLLFSSLASALGNPGQADYACANGFMDQYAHYRNALGAQGLRQGRTVAINWPLWEQGGMRIDDAAGASMSALGMLALQDEMGIQALHGAVALGEGQVLLMHGAAEPIKRVLSGGPLAAPTRVASVTPAPADGQLDEKARQFLRGQLSNLLQIPVSRIDAQAALETYGIDSILAMNLTRELEKSFGPLSKTLLFEYQTLAALARYFIDEHGATLGALFAHPEAPAKDSAAAPVAPPHSPAPGRRKHARASGQQRPASAVARQDEPIAIIGMSGRYPQSRDLDAFWTNLRDGRDCVTEVPPERWNWREHYSEDRSEEGRHYSKWGGFIEGVDEFDPLFFNISPREARYIDPQERLFLQHAWMAMEDAGYTRAGLQLPRAGDLAGQVGVYAGVMYGEYQLFGAQAAVHGASMPIANSYASIANRVSYALNLHGPSMTLDTMCSSSLTAIHLACQDLKLGRTDMAIAGGVNVSIHPQKYLMLSAGQFISSDGHCQSFGEGGDGYIPGEGVGIVVLKRLSDAERDGDTIHGVILGSSLNHGGKTNGYTVPNPHAQSSAIARTLAEARVDPRHVSYVEAHGTGTTLGDPIEIAALTKAFGQHTQERGFCRIGSAKSNIGHCESAAGIAGLMKVLLQMRHGEIAASLHASTLNPHIDFAQTPFVVNRSLTAWERPQVDGREVDRIAGLSSFGAGGSNAHMIVREYRHAAPAVATPGPQVVLLSARTEEQLHERARDLLRHVAGHGDALDVASVAHTLQVGREAMDERLGMVVDSAAQLREQLSAFVEGRSQGGEVYRGRVKRNGEGLGQIGQDEEMKEAIDKWIARKKYGKLLELWTQGLDLDWARLAAEGTRRRVSLPAYPFARERHWIEAVPASRAASTLHPLLHANTSDMLEQCYTSWFDGQEPFLAHHQVRLDGQGSRKVLPAVAYLEMAREAIRLAIPAAPGSCLVLTQTVWAQPVLVDGRTKVSIALQAGAQGAIEFEVFSQAGDGQERVHCQGQGAYLPAAAHTLDLGHLAQQMQGATVAGDDLYGQLHAMGLEYGAGHRAVHSLALGDGQLLARLQLPAALEAAAPAYVLHPSLMDAALQASMGLLRGEPGAPLMLPYAVASVQILGACSASMLAWVREGEGSAPGLRKLDIDLCDEQGRVSVQLRGFSVRPVEAQAAQPVWAVPVWEAAPVEAAAAMQQRQVWLLGQPEVDLAALEGALAGSRCQRLDGGEGDAAARFLDLSGACFAQVQALLGAKLQGSTPLQLIVTDAGDEALLAGLAGLLRSTTAENPQLRGQLVLVAPGLDTAALAQLLQGAPGPQALVRYRDGRREVQRWRERPWLGAVWPGAFRDNGVYLITGGLGGLGRVFAAEIMAQTAHARVVLTGRGALDAARREQLESLSPEGRVHYRQLALDDAAQVQALVAAVCREHGRLDGIIHSAGQVADGFILNKTAAQWHAVLGPKVTGTLNLDAASAHLPLDFMVLFSSLASALGNAGQADYASANGFLDQYAQHRNALAAKGERHGRTVAINWPLWEEGGMQVDQAGLAMLRSVGMVPLQSRAGVQAFYGALAQDAGQVMVLQGERDQLVRLLAGGAEPPAATPASAPTLSGAALEEETQDYLRKQLAGILQLAAGRIDVHAPMETYGIDSVMSMSLVRTLEKTFGPLSKTLLFEYQTLAQLALYFVDAHRASLGALFAQPLLAHVAAAPAQAVAASGSSRRKAGRQAGPLPARELEPIAIVGMSGRFPQARDLAAFWRNLRDGLDCVTEVPPERWNWREHFSDDRSEAGRHYSKWGGFIEGVDEFDPLFFNISPREARYIDPQERLFLQHAWMAMEDAGYTRAALQLPRDGDLAGQVGVYAGVMYSEYQLFGAAGNAAGQATPVGSSVAGIANRVSYALNLHGPSMTLDTMCSSSLTAIHLACQDLKHGRTDMAIAGGVNVTIHPQKYLTLSAGQFISSDGHCQSFGEGGDGYIPGEGVGIVVLKRLSDAERDGDTIHGVILGSGLNHGGKTNGYTVPNPQAQASAIARTLAEARVDARHVTYVEAHGTGTKLGDPIEIAALAKAFGQHTQERGFCRIGSAKSNIGHCESAAGIAGLMKVLLQMRHGEIAASLHASTLNPHIDFEQTPFVVNRSLTAWERAHVDGREIDRIAGLSSFGAGGSNAHMIVQEYRKRPLAAPASAAESVFVLSARTPEQLQRKAQDLLAYVEQQGDALDLAAVAYTLQVGREAMDERLGFLARDAGQLCARLGAFITGQAGMEDTYTGQARRSRDGMGLISQDDDMKEAIEKWIARKKLGKLLELWAGGLDLDWRKLYPEGSRNRVSLPAYPFASDRYWIDAAPSRAGTAGTLHPLVHANTSDLHQQGYASRFDGGEFFLADHQVRLGGKGSAKVLPAVAYLEMAVAAIGLALPAHAGMLELRQVVWAQPLTVTGPSSVSIGIQAGEHIEYEIHSQDEDGLERVHCHGRAAHVPAAMPAPIALASLQAQMQGGAVSGEQLYADLHAIGLEYGPAHRAVRSLALGDGQLLAWLQLPPQLEAAAASYVLHPSLMDAALQACLGLLRTGEGGPLLLPYAVESVRMPGRCMPRMLAWVRKGEGSLPLLRKLDIDLCDEQGQVCVQLRGFSARPVQSQAPGLMWAAPAWAPAPQDTSPDVRQRHVWLLGLPQVDAAALGVSRCQHLHSTAADVAGRYLALAGACFEQLQALLRAPLQGRTLVQLVVADDGADALLAGLAGLLRTASQENPQLIGQLVLAAPDTGTAALAQLLQGEQGAQALVRYRDGQRQVQQWREQPWLGAARPVAWRDNGVYLISGGLGGLGRVFARAILDQTTRAQVVLTGRGALDPARAAQLASLASPGRVHYRQVDLEDAGQVRELVAAVCAEHGRLDGILHSAGQVADSFILKKTAAEWRAVLGPKVAGTVHLDLASAHLPLDFMVLFSSLASALGNAGQADYASANGFMDQYAQMRNELAAKGERHGRTVSINWPLWEQGGMSVDAAAMGQLRELGMEPLHTDAGLQALHGALAQDSAQVLLVQGDLRKLKRFLGQEAPVAMPRPAATAPLAGGLDERTRQLLRREMAAILQMPASRIDVRAPLDTYGIDSVMSMDLVRVLEKTFGPLSKTLLFEYQSVEALARYFVAEHAAQLHAMLDAPQPSVQAPAAALPPAARARRRFHSESAVAASERVEVAIVGVSGQYPQAADLAAYWENLRSGKDCITGIPSERWDIDAVYDAARGQPGKTYGKWGGFISDADRFDPLFFGISPREAERMDPQERLFLQTTWKAVEDAGYSRQHLAGSRIGVFVGVMWAQYDLVGNDAAHRGGSASAGSSHASIANRISYVFDWHGPSMALDTMCSSSLSAIHLACESIRSGESDAAVAGGVNLSIHPQKYLSLAEGNFLAGDGRCRSFGQGGDGYVPGEGVGALVLKRLDHALRDGDHVYAVVRASGINHGGKTNGYSVPNPAAQGQLIRDVLARGGVAPASINYIEAHGTGTALGDPIEIKGLLAAFSGAECPPQSCPIGSVKSNIGHLEAAAGVAAVSKVLLQMKHGQLAPSLHAGTENAYIDFAATPFMVQKALSDWTPRERDVRRACVSSFGAGGSNAHLVLDELTAAPLSAPLAGPEVLLISARDSAALRRYCVLMADWLAAPGAVRLADIAYTTQVGRVALNARLAVVASSCADMQARLREWLALPEQDGKARAQAMPEGVVQGDARALQDQVGDLLSGAGESFSGELLKNRDLPRLAQLWALGAEVDWRQLPRHAAPQRVALPTYPFARDRYWVAAGDGPRTRAASVAAMPATRQYYRPQWLAEPLDDAASDAGAVLLLGGSDALAEALQGAGAALVRANWGTAFGEEGQGGFVLDPAAEGDFGRLVQALREQQRLPTRIIHACAADQGGVYALLYLCKAWLAQKVAGPVRLLSVFTGTRALPAPYGAALAGFYRSLAAENSRFSGTTLELEAADWPAAAVGILRELHARVPAGGAVRHVPQAAGQAQRLVRALLPHAIADDAGQALPVRQGGVYLITGGLGGLGLVFAKYLAGTFKARLVLSGRSEPSPAQQEALALLRQLGAQVQYVRADVASSAAVAALVAEAKTRFGAIDGVIHAAGVTRDALLPRKTAQDMALVLAAKVDGTIHLDRATRNERLDWFVLFSSLAAETGNPGQCDYAYGNHFMDSYAEARELWRQDGQCSGHTLSINWPLWADGGMHIDAATEALMEQETGLRALPTADGLRCFEELLASGLTQATAVYGDAARIAAHVARGRLAPDAGVVAPGADAVGLREYAERFLCEVVGEEIKLPAGEVDTGERFEAYGFDSVMVARVHARLEKAFGPLPKTLLFERETVAELASYLVEEAGAALTRLFGVAPVAAVPVALAAKPAAAPAPTLATAEPIAIIGVHGRYPGSNDLDAYWDNLSQGNDLVELVPASRWRFEDYYDADPQAAAYGKIYCKWGGFVDDADQFDPGLFNMTVDEARSTDPQERLFLQSVWCALEDAGYSRDELRARHPKGKGASVGVYVGVTSNTYNLNLAGAAPEGAVVPSALPWSVANRASYVFNFEGPSMPVDTACSSSLVALHLACASLRSGECDVAVAGGVNLYLHPSKYQSLCGRRMVSADGACRSYGAGGDGFVPGEGVGSLILKPLSRAIADGDRIHAVIRASACAHGGRSNGYSAPSPNAQASLIEATLAEAGIDAASIGCIEGHGTGTPLGDGIEVAAMAKAFRSAGADAKFCSLGSVKANIGHAESAAGIAGLTKVLLQMRHRQLAPTLHADQPNPNIEWDETPFYLQRTLAPWTSAPGQPRRALVNSFGAGGVNACVVLEEYQQPASVAAAGDGALFTLSARSTPALEAYADLFLAYLERHPQADLAAVCRSLQIGREAMEERLAVVAASGDELVVRLRAWRQQAAAAGVYRGRVEKRRAKPVKAAAGTTLAQLHGLAKAWVEGAAVPWSALYGANAPACMSLPNYPFELQRCWYAGPTVSVPAQPAARMLHPMVSHNASTLNEVSFSSYLPDSAFYALDHTVAGTPLLPGAACMEIALACCMLAAERRVAALRDIVWIRPVSFADGPQSLRTILRQAADGVEYAVTSLGPEHERLVHCEGRLLLEGDPALAVYDGAPVAIEQLAAACAVHYSGQQFYEQMARGGLVYGASFHVVQDVHLGDGYALLKLALPASLDAGFRDFTLHPALLDGALHSVAALLVDQGGPFLPFALDGLDLVRPLTPVCYALVEYAEVPANARQAIRKIDVRVCDERGALLMRLDKLYLRQLNDGLIHTTVDMDATEM